VKRFSIIILRVYAKESKNHFQPQNHFSQRIRFLKELESDEALPNRPTKTPLLSMEPAPIFPSLSNQAASSGLEDPSQGTPLYLYIGGEISGGVLYNKLYTVYPCGRVHTLLVP
jgi:hypothetical protein